MLSVPGSIVDFGDLNVICHVCVSEWVVIILARPVLVLRSMGMDRLGMAGQMDGKGVAEWPLQGSRELRRRRPDHTGWPRPPHTSLPPLVQTPETYEAVAP